MSLLLTLNDQQAERLNGGVAPTENPAARYDGMNYGQAKKGEPDYSNPSQFYGGSNYGLYKKSL